MKKATSVTQQDHAANPKLNSQQISPVACQQYQPQNAINDVHQAKHTVENQQGVVHSRNVVVITVKHADGHWINKEIILDRG